LERLHSGREARGFIALVDGIVPIGSGLSSSSSLVCAAALATTLANNQHIEQIELATLCMHSERYVGLESGGMDQAISYLARRGTAKLIEFNPLITYDVILPSGATFVICNSLVESNKYVTANTCYNMRVVECRLAAVVLAKKLALPNWIDVRQLIHVQKLSRLSLSKLIDAVKMQLHIQSYTIHEIANILELELETVISKYLNQIDCTAMFELYKRALHVFSESNRVYEFRDICEKHFPDCNMQLVELGNLMNASQESCDQLFDCSCPELNRLTFLCRQYGALGSRLTGAGWGGCTISLVPRNKLESFCEQIKEQYYYQELGLSENALQEKNALFVSEPGGGASVYMPSS